MPAPRLCVACLILLVLGSVYAQSDTLKSVVVDLTTKWQSYPLYLEAGEYMSKISNEHFWEYLETITPTLSACKSDEDQYSAIFDAAASITTATQRNQLDLDLNLRSNNPTLEVFRQQLQHVRQQHSAQFEKQGDNFVLYNGHPFFTVDTLKEAVETQTEYAFPSSLADGNRTTQDADVYATDHIYPGQTTRSSTAVLYADITSVEFGSFHSYLKEQPKVKYVFRPTTTQALAPISLQGYGVELAIKNVEYKVLDDQELAQHDNVELPDSASLFQELKDVLPSFNNEWVALEKSIREGLQPEELTTAELPHFGVKVASLIHLSPDPLRALRIISQNLPLIARVVLNTPLDNDVQKKLMGNRRHIEDGTNMLMINGQRLDLDNLGFHKLVDIIKDEMQRIDHLQSTDVTPSQLERLLAIDISTPVNAVFPVVGPSIIYMNDLENDPQYSKYSGNLNDVLGNAPWGAPLHYIRKNLYSVVAILDPYSNAGQIGFELMSLVMRHQLPLRIGFVVAGNPIQDEPRDISVLFYNCIQTLVARKDGHRGLFSFFHMISQLDGSPTEDTLRWAFSSAAQGLSFDSVMMMSPEKAVMGQELVLELGFESDSHIFFNGRLLDTSRGFAATVGGSLMQERNRVAKAVKVKDITVDSTDIYAELVSKSLDAVSQYHPTIFVSDDKPAQFARFTGPFRTMLQSTHFLRNPETAPENIRHTYIVVSDLHSEVGRKLAQEAVKRLDSEYTLDARVAIFSAHSDELAHLFYHFLLRIPSTNDGLNTVLSVLGAEVTESSLLAALSELDPEAAQKFQESISEPRDRFEAEWVAAHDLEANCIVYNGRILQGPLNVDHFPLLEVYTQKLYAGKILTAIDDEHAADRLMILPSLIHATFGDMHFKLPATHNIFASIDRPDAALKIQWIVNPLSAPAQRLSSMLEALIQVLPIDLKITLSVEQIFEKMPLKNYFRFAAHQLSFDASGSIVQPRLVFDGLPQSKVLTMNVYPPSAWLVEPVFTHYDLDNIYLESVKENALLARFELESILLEGSAADLGNRGGPPRGLKLILGDVSEPHRVDTIVMANLGYFQLKANPGVWQLQIEDDSYAFVTASGKRSSLDVVLSSFTGVYIMPKVEKSQLVEVVEEGGEEAWSGFGSLWGSGSTTGTNETVNVFSVASGHLYERFLKIMMLSVKQNTKNPVKFWFIKNFLSPQFKAFVPKMAKQHGFEVELVQYKFPSWLNGQTEKQRLIWAYKILFLDVLFPLDVKKVIFIDADQIVNTDLAQLYDVDLQGAVYGFTPFCTGEIAREETKQFRFWETGFWKEHLGGKPYHISALFVVDLVRFRKEAAGDRLRATYNSLSNDPNSLANLDQDLPNYMQHALPIHSLSREWLWCETWCSDDSKAEAKTIDLCNNPLTKTPKLENAHRVIGQRWTDLDNEAKSIQ